MGNVSIGSSIFYLTKCLRCILYSLLLLLITFFLLFSLHFYDKNLGLVVSVYVNSIAIKGIFFSKFSNKCCTIPHIRMFFCSLLFFISVIINPGLNWKLNSIVAHNFIKMSLLQAYNAIYKFDIICLSETYLDNSYHSDDDHLAFPGYNLIRADKPNNIKKRRSLHLILRNFTSKSNKCEYSK